MLLSRERFANGLRVCGIDQDCGIDQEYAGRFCDYLGGSYVQICTPAEAVDFNFAAVSNPDVVIWDLHNSDERDRGAIFAALKPSSWRTCSSSPAAQRSSLTRP